LAFRCDDSSVFRVIADEFYLNMDTSTHVRFFPKWLRDERKRWSAGLSRRREHLHARALQIRAKLRTHIHRETGPQRPTHSFWSFLFEKTKLTAARLSRQCRLIRNTITTTTTTTSSSFSCTTPVTMTTTTNTYTTTTTATTHPPSTTTTNYVYHYDEGDCHIELDNIFVRSKAFFD